LAVKGSQHLRRARTGARGAAGLGVVRLSNTREIGLIPGNPLRDGPL